MKRFSEVTLVVTIALMVSLFSFSFAAQKFTIEENFTYENKGPGTIDTGTLRISLRSKRSGSLSR